MDPDDRSAPSSDVPADRPSVPVADAEAAAVLRSATPEFDHELAAAVNAALVGELDEGLAVDPNTPFGDERRLFAALYVRHRYSIGQTAWRYLKDQRDVDEVVQETFLRLFLALPDLESEAQAVAWCRRTAANLCIDRYRAAQRRPSLVDLDNVAHELVVEEEPSDPLVQAEDAAIVRHALAMLSPLHREALVKREIEEKSIPEIAAELDIPEESVKHVLYRARRALRRLLADTTVAPGRGTALLIVIALVMSLPTVIVPALKRAAGLGGDRGRVESATSPPSGRLGSTPTTPTVGSPPALSVASPQGEPAKPAVQDTVTAPPVTAVPAKPSTPVATARQPLVRAPREATAPSAPTREAAIEAPAQTLADAPEIGAATAEAPAAAELAAAPVAATAAPVAARTFSSEPRFTLKGMPVISTEAFVQEQALDLDASGATVARSTFVGQTLDVDLTLNQTMRRNTDQSIVFSFQPLITQFGQTLIAKVMTYDASAVTNDDGTVTVSVLAALDSPIRDAGLRPFGSTGAAVTPAEVEPIPRLVRILAVYSGDLTDLLRESVTAS